MESIKHIKTNLPITIGDKHYNETRKVKVNQKRFVKLMWTPSVSNHKENVHQRMLLIGFLLQRSTKIK